MRKYHVSHKGEGAPVTLIRREFGVDTPLAVFYPEVGYDLSRAVSDLIAAALDSGRKDIFILQVPTSHGKLFDTRLLADRISSVDGTEIDVAFYRKEADGTEDCIAHVLAGVDAKGAPRVRIKSVGKGGKRYLEVNLSAKVEEPAKDAPADTPKPEAKPAEKPAELPATTPSQA